MFNLQPSGPLYENDVANRTYGYPKSGSTKISSSFNNNLSELDNLLEDLSSSKYGNRKSKTNLISTFTFT